VICLPPLANLRSVNCLDEQWLLSVAHTEADITRALDVLASFLDELRSV
jgi:hypothetical protein